ncbi:MAG: PD-(D/E)XK nuclease family protein [Muribaculaceae bacterium]|nr:PD-(D/E)XK nuclease family protein [Muribaculaceae bacterium]
MLTNYSPNMLKTYKTCPRKYYYRYIENIVVPKSSLPFEKGKKIHALANYSLQGINISRIETALSDAEKEVWASLLNNSYFGKTSVQSEYTLTCKIGEYWVGGRLDAVVKDGENYYILDYKTGSIPKNPMYDFQTMVYLLCLDKVLRTYDSLSFVYIGLKNNKDYVIGFNPGLKSEYENLIEDMCKKIESDTLYDRCSDDCAHCEYAKLCL